MIKIEIEYEISPLKPNEWSVCDVEGFKFKCWMENETVFFLLKPESEPHFWWISPKSIHLTSGGEDKQFSARVITEKRFFERSGSITKKELGRDVNLLVCDVQITNEGFERFASKHPAH
jgi:hypothetical protein